MPVESQDKFADPLMFDTSVIFNVGHRGDLENLIQRLSEQHTLLVPPGVLEETQRDDNYKAYYDEFVGKYFKKAAGKISATNAEAIAKLAMFLGSGELDVIILALDTGGTAVLDERIARREARALNITVIGTLGLLRHAIQKGWMSENEVLEKIELMRENGFNIRPVQPGQSFTDYLMTLGD